MRIDLFTLSLHGTCLGTGEKYVVENLETRMNEDV
jgi:hypothetical protein